MAEPREVEIDDVTHAVDIVDQLNEMLQDVGWAIAIGGVGRPGYKKVRLVKVEE